MPDYTLPLLPGQLYHIYTHANGGENLFPKEQNYSFFLMKYAHHISPVADTLAYCLMPNHLHLLVRMKPEEVVRRYAEEKKKGGKNLRGFDRSSGVGGKDLRGFDQGSMVGKDLTGFENLSGLLSKQFSNLFNSYSKAYNKMYNRRGSLFERPFKRKPVTSDAYLLRLVAYIHLNPVHHGFAERAGDWPHSSCRAYVEPGRRSRICRDLLLHLAGGPEAFEALHRDWMPGPDDQKDGPAQVRL
ncbi:MAG: hypothetical protein JJU35_10595 [Balneolales bacterium]|nr:hypothetical protein [Balneolales bacterium]